SALVQGSGTRCFVKSSVIIPGIWQQGLKIYHHRFSRFTGYHGGGLAVITRGGAPFKMNVNDLTEQCTDGNRLVGWASEYFGKCLGYRGR
ncbi:MAG: hypothetical protein RIQ78_751, partial [Bacteroidota bacterium]